MWFAAWVERENNVYSAGGRGRACASVRRVEGQLGVHSQLAEESELLAGARPVRRSHQR